MLTRRTLLRGVLSLAALGPLARVALARRDPAVNAIPYSDMLYVCGSDGLYTFFPADPELSHCVAAWGAARKDWPRR